jgi:glycosyltransferase involved in cell wall biosynthesis
LKISVCMATKNGGEFIREQLESILIQMQPDDEIVISDDSSTDSTLDIIAGFTDSRIRLFKNNTFYDPRWNFENALKNSSGDVLILSDQDDVWLDNKIAVIRDIFKGSRSPVHLVVLDAYVCDSTGTIIEDSLFHTIKAGKGVVKNIFDNTYVGCCMAFSRPLLEIALPFPQRIPMHDMWLGLLAELFGTVKFVNVKTMCYRRHAANMTELKFRFQPIIQISRRFFLTYYLGKRFLTRKISGHGNVDSSLTTQR